MDVAGTSPGVYVHVPFCSAVCPYCDFAVLRGRSEEKRAFAGQMARELELRAPEQWRADTLYFGGGTPSALRPDELAEMIEAVGRAVRLDEGTKIFLEVNPEDVSLESVSAWRQLGVTFLSLGVQSFDDVRLRFLGRRHRRTVAQNAVSMAVEAGFDTVNVDVIYALPGESFEVAAADFECAARLGATHISAYELTIHQGTPFARWRDRGGLIELGEEAQADLLLQTHAHLAQLGFEGYEVSNFARGPLHRSAHNQKYWNHVPYLGVGPSAHSFDGSRRWWNLRGLREWATALGRGELPVAGAEVIGPQERYLEAMMLGLRTTAGVDLERLAGATGLAAAADGVALIRALGDGLLMLEGTTLRPSVRGMALADRLALELAAAAGPVRA